MPECFVMASATCLQCSTEVQKMRTDFLSLVSMAISEQEAHQLLAVHRGGQFVLDEFARPRVDGRKVGLGMSRAGH
ncbi:MAG: hypothetical protein ACI4RA_11140 [Kiritimatiellia bacterium]